MASTTTKSSKNSKKQSTLAPVHKIPGPTIVGNQQYIPEPPLEEEKWCIYQSQVLISISIFGMKHAILGPLPYVNVNPAKLKEFFPTYHYNKPIASKKKTRVNTEVTEKPSKSSTEPTENPINLDYMNNFRLFLSFPLFKDPKVYLAWLAKVEKRKTQVWKNMGIFYMIQLSKVGPGYSQDMLIASLYF